MAKKALVPGAVHFGTKQVMAPAIRQNVLSIRVGPEKRMQSPVKPVKADKPSNVGNF